jgi:hypothetical protein
MEKTFEVQVLTEGRLHITTQVLIKVAILRTFIYACACRPLELLILQYLQRLPRRS